jgi:hypothetical protein
MTHVQVAIWAYRGPQSGQILSMERVDADQAIADGWGQDMVKTDGRHLIYAEPPAPFPPDPPTRRKRREKDDDDGDESDDGDDEGDESEGEPAAPKRGRGRPRKDG